MQVVCDSCQLNFDVPEGTVALACPICRRILKPAFSADAPPEEEPALEWAGGSIDELVEMLTGPAIATRIEVLTLGGPTPVGVGEVHLLAGGISEAIHGQERGDGAMDLLRAVRPALYRVRAVLPDPEDGDLSRPGAQQGSLTERSLAKLMRYCEMYVLTCTVEVWRGNESAHVEYAKGDIARVVVGGMDAPERLADVIRWSSGNYRIVMPRLALPQSDASASSRSSASHPVAREPDVAPSPRSTTGRNTIVGVASPIVAPAAPAAPQPAAVVSPEPAARPSMSRTIFGISAPVIPASPQSASPAAAEAPAAPEPGLPAMPLAPTEGDEAARSAAPSLSTTMPFVPVVSSPPEPAARRFTSAGLPIAIFDAPVAGRVTNPGVTVGSTPAAAPRGSSPRATGGQAPSRPSVISDVGSDAHVDPRHTRPGFVPARPEVILQRAPAKTDGRQQAARQAVKPYLRGKPGGVAREARKESPFWVYIAVGFSIGLAFVGIYWLAHFLASR